MVSLNFNPPPPPLHPHTHNPTHSDATLSGNVPADLILYDGSSQCAFGPEQNFLNCNNCLTMYDQAPFGNPACTDPVAAGQPQELSTPDGSPVNQPFFSVPDGDQLGQIDFPTVSQAGVTTVTPIGQVVFNRTVTGNPAAAYSISTTADYTGPVQVCLRYDAAAYPEGVVPYLYASVEGGAWTDVTTTDLGGVVDGGLICGSIPSLPARVALMYSLGPLVERDEFRLKKVGLLNQPDASNKGRPGQKRKGDAWTFSGHLGVCGNSTAGLLHEVDAGGMSVILGSIVGASEGPVLDSIAFTDQECKSGSRGEMVCTKPKPTRRSGGFKGSSNDYEIGTVTFAPLPARKGVVCPGVSVSASMKLRNLQGQSLMPARGVRFGLQVNLIVGGDIYKASLFRCKVKSKGRGTLSTVKIACRPA